MKPKPLLSEKAITRMLQEAARSWQQGDHAEYFSAMERVASVDPGNDRIAIDLGAAHAMRYEYPAAQQWFERAVAISENKSETLAMIGLQCRNANRYEMAEQYLERASAQKGATADTLTKLAEMYERLRRLDKARETVDRALRQNGTNALALLVSARLERSAGRLEAGERIVRSFLSRSDRDSWSTRIRGWYELGANLDRQGRYDEAMAAYLSAKAMIRPIAQQAIASQRQVHLRLTEAAETIPQDLLQRWGEAATSEAHQHPPTAVICGHPRSGTTLLEQLLDSHPGVVSAEETAIFFESYLALRRAMPAESGMRETLESATPNVLGELREWYFRSMQAFIGDPIGSRLLIDKNPSLTGLIPALVRLIPNVRLVVAIRDPRDVCMSCFMQPLPLNSVSSSYLSLEETAAEYTSLMGFWLAMKPRLPNPAIEVRYEDTVKDVEAVSRRVLSFLGLEWDPRVLRFDEHARQKLVRSPTYAEVARPISAGAVGRWKNYEKFLQPVLEKLAPFIQASGYES